MMILCVIVLSLCFLFVMRTIASVMKEAQFLLLKVVQHSDPFSSMERTHAFYTAPLSSHLSSCQGRETFLSVWLPVLLSASTSIFPLSPLRV